MESAEFNLAPDASEADVWSHLDHYRGRLRRIVDLRIHPKVRARVDPSDVIQESLCEVVERLPRYREAQEMPFYLWVRFITVQKLMQLHRRHLNAEMRDARREAPLANTMNSAISSIALANAFVASGVSPSQAMSREEDIERLSNALETMKEEDREIIALRHFEQLPNAEAAIVLGLKESAASRRHIRALRRLKEILADR